MLKTDRIIIVEGKYDKIKLSSIIDAVIIETDGFGIFKDKQKQKLLRMLADKKGLVILTDSDSAGFTIRNFICGFVPKEKIINAYIPDVFGKERRKDAPSKEGKLGVEGVSSSLIKAALEKAGVLCSEDNLTGKRIVTKTDFYLDGLTGGNDSKEKRLALLNYLSLPERMTTNALIEIINSFMTYDDYKNAVKAIERVEAQ
ncbi:MAG: DUF4093 domain-containing protein [Clostridia bacterium]|nr:DUF4093 domain-containing protein [Clostridia bacterium]